MAYSIVPTAVTGDLWTAANHNTYIKDNFAAAIPGAFTTAGQMAYATGANTGALLNIGTAGQVLRVNNEATAPEWAADFSGARMTTSDQDCSTGTITVNFNAEEYDTHSYWSADNPDAVSMPWSGIYQFTGHANFAALNVGTTGKPLFIAYLGQSTNTNTNMVSMYCGAAGEETTLSWAHTQYCSSGTDMCLRLYCGAYGEQTTDFTADVDYQVTWLGTT